MIRWGLVGILCASVWLSGCAYRWSPVPPLGEPVQVEVVHNRARVVRVQGYLQEAVAAAVEQRLGWQVRANGSAKLQLFIDEERIATNGSDARGIAVRWTIRSEGSAILSSKRGHITTTWEGTGYSSGISDEAEALRQAARSVADQLAVWLEHEADRWPR